MPKKQPLKFKVDVEFEGKVYSAVYVVSSGTITVKAEYGSLTTHGGGPNVKFMARQLLREILESASLEGNSNPLPPFAFTSLLALGARLSGP